MENRVIVGDYRCSTCGAPATHAVRDEILMPDDGSGIEQYQLGELRFGCDEHRMMSVRLVWIPLEPDQWPAN